jgi:hypothetical protein
MEPDRFCRYCTLFSVSLIQFIPSHPISTRSILVLSSIYALDIGPCGLWSRILNVFLISIYVMLLSTY